MRALLLVLIAVTVAAAAPLQRDLGEGLIYFRVHHLPSDLPADSALKARPCVLDLRYVKGDAAMAAVLRNWLKGHAAVSHPILLLANADTSAALLTPLASADAVPGVVIIAPQSATFAADISVPDSPRRERRAYDALEQGTPVEKLLDDNPPKARNDEARLDRDHISDEEMEAETDDAPPSDAPAPPRPLVDAELQRAVQLHRALLALKRL
ncbi:MAG TPA: hypothetical protein VFE31_13690 [Opitutaceae bacterium]|jgi:hypothetical protein|nr:hypothetical protein [Opitutaceae bacterium]